MKPHTTNTLLPLSQALLQLYHKLPVFTDVFNDISEEVIGQDLKFELVPDNFPTLKPNNVPLENNQQENDQIQLLVICIPTVHNVPNSYRPGGGGMVLDAQKFTISKAV